MDTEKNKVSESVQQVQICQENIQNPQIQPLPPQKTRKQLFAISKGDTAFAICAVVASIFASMFGIFGGFALGYLLSVVLMIILYGIYFAKSGKVSIFPIVCGVLSLSNAAVFICTSNGSVRFFSVIISFLLSLVFYNGLTNCSSKGNRQTLGVFYSAASTIGNVGITVKSIFSNRNDDKKTMRRSLIGVLCAIPVLVIVVPLLISSDDAFRGMMGNIFSNTFTAVFKIIFGIGISFFAVSYGFSLKTDRVAKVRQRRFSGLENTYIVSFMSAISVCYLLYLFSQLAYFFSAFKGFLPNGEITYAQYARKGFFEMCIIAVINLVIVFLALILAKKQNGKVCHTIKAIATFIAMFTLVVITTAISKMVLYIDYYGMTVLRLTTSSFMLFLAIVFISVILRIYITKINIVKVVLVTAGFIVLILGTVNVNAVCAKYNYESYKNGKLKTIDIEALYDLGDEGIPYIVKLAESKKNGNAKIAKRYLAEAYRYDYFKDMYDVESFTLDDLKKNQKDKGFEHFSIPKYKAYNELYKFIEKNPKFSSESPDYLITEY